MAVISSSMETVVFLGAYLKIKLHKTAMMDTSRNPIFTPPTVQSMLMTVDGDSQTVGSDCELNQQLLRPAG